MDSKLASHDDAYSAYLFEQRNLAIRILVAIEQSGLITELQQCFKLHKKKITVQLDRIGRNHKIRQKEPFDHIMIPVGPWINLQKNKP
uniref:HTH_48 domain-containing protein n=1 Tax=Ascaris lumbricoides TaxID=6252 RepID=A0A0M3HIJ5_ASCLU